MGEGARQEGCTKRRGPAGSLVPTAAAAAAGRVTGIITLSATTRHAPLIQTDMPAQPPLVSRSTPHPPTHSAAAPAGPQPPTAAAPQAALALPRAPEVEAWRQQRQARGRSWQRGGTHLAGIAADRRGQPDRQRAVAAPAELGGLHADCCQLSLHQARLRSGRCSGVSGAGNGEAAHR